MIENKLATPASLIEPNFIERNPEKITQEWIALYEEKTGKKLQPAQIERILIDVGVYRENLLRIAIQEAAKQNLVNFATYPMLDYLGELVGVKRLEAKPAKTTIRFSLTETQSFNILIQTGTQIESKDGKVIFKTLINSFIPAGSMSVDVQAECENLGTIGNGYLSGEINNLISPIGYIENSENISITGGGADEESDEALRQRIKSAPEQFSNAGSKGAYKFFATSSHPDIVDVAVLSPTPGVVKIYPLTKSGNPSQAILDTVDEALNDDKIRPLTDNIIVESPQKVDFTITADITLYSFADSTSVLSQINLKINSYISDMKSKLGKDIVPSQIITIINSVYGVYKVVLISPIYTQLQDYNWANCTATNINIAGYTNG